ncbi:MAG: imidazole glycerol phosphate synthase subunit HisF [Actinobacteria bacterium]|nr:imidazole glycerol phosphate synthase subunit HisF [Actinomycetota bacterium]MDA2984696.1 imidazole glycerol phosphate synthase subunit HisF [Actinomycetota bacterium]
MDSTAASALIESLAVRVIPCLDVKDGRVVKGVNFSGLIDAGDPVELAALYDAQGADELTFLDISASVDERKTTIDIVRATAEEVFIPLTVGGGIRSIADVDELLRAGADKVSVNTAALQRPELIDEIARTFGSQVLVLSVDARRNDQFKSNFQVTTHGGSRGDDRDAKSWIKEALDRGVGEILLNSVDADGTKEGYDEEMIRSLRPITSVPLIASGGAGKISDFSSALAAGADAVLAASVFHFAIFTISEVKNQLKSDGFTVRGAGL